MYFSTCFDDSSNIGRTHFLNLNAFQIQSNLHSLLLAKPSKGLYGHHARMALCMEGKLLKIEYAAAT
jgi:hypothetical protein